MQGAGQGAAYSLGVNRSHSKRFPVLGLAVTGVVNIDIAAGCATAELNLQSSIQYVFPQQPAFSTRHLAFDDHSTKRDHHPALCQHCHIHNHRYNVYRRP